MSTGAQVKSVSITNETEVSAEDIIQVANNIWKSIRERKIDISNEEETSRLLDTMRTEYKEFSMSYPIVLRYMCQFGSYSSKAFSLYLSKIKTHPWKSHPEYLDSQADYVCLLYKAKNPKWNRREVDNLRVRVRALLQDEHDTFMKKFEEVKAQLEAAEKIYEERRKEDIRFLAEKDKLSTEEPTVRVDTSSVPLTSNNRQEIVPVEPALSARDLLA